jgi:hypothetical protein
VVPWSARRRRRVPGLSARRLAPVIGASVNADAVGRAPLCFKASLHRLSQSRQVLDSQHE